MRGARQAFGSGQFTGYHMVGVMVAFFGVIIAVNLTMARFAITSWSGLVVPNTYVASQDFNAHAKEARAIAALGYTAEISASAQGFLVLLHDRTGAPTRAAPVTVAFHRPVGAVGDRDVTLEDLGPGRYLAAGQLPEGDWIAHIRAFDGQSVIVRKAIRFHVDAGGELRP